MMKLTFSLFLLGLVTSQISAKVNLALNRPTVQSSTGSNGPPNYAVDGNANRDYFQKSCSHTLLSTSPWWRVDLGRDFVVTGIRVVNRQDCCGERLSNFEIRIGSSLLNNGLSNALCGGKKFSLQQGEDRVISCSTPLYGRYVTISIPGEKKILTLCEVEVYGLDGDVEAFINTDNTMTVYADGENIGQDDNGWTVASRFIVPAETRVIAIHAKDTGGPAGIIGSFSSGMITNEDWKCSKTSAYGWTNVEFDDSEWPNAKVLGTNLQPPGYWKHIPFIYDNAKWIWTADNRNDNEVFCRIKVLSLTDREGTESCHCSCNICACTGSCTAEVYAPLGSRLRPASSCQAIREANREAESGAYYLKGTDSNTFRAYCHMGTLGGCGDGAWTTVMKINGNKNTFQYTSALWSNKHEYQPESGTSGLADQTETKLASYWSTPIKQVCLGMNTGNSPKWIKIPIIAQSLHSVIADGKYRRTTLGRDIWKSLVSGSSLQRNCRAEGFNVVAGTSGHLKIRIGIAGNQENDCKTPDSFLGFGVAMAPYVGNYAHPTWKPDNGGKNTKSFGFVYVQ